MAKKRYFILGDNASSFSDAKSGLDISNKNVGEVDSRLFKNSTVAKQAFTAGHIKEVSEAEAEKIRESSGQNAARKMVERTEKRKAFLEQQGVTEFTSNLDKLDKAIAAQAKEEAEDDEEENEADDEEEENEDEDEEEENEDDDEELTKADMVKAIQASAEITAEEKKGLSSKKVEDVKKLFAKIK